MNEMKPIIKRWVLANYTSVKWFTFWKVSAKICNFRVSFIRGFPSHEWNDTHPWTMTASRVYECKSFTFWKVSSKICTFRVPVYKRVPLPWMKWNPSFNDCDLPSVRLWKVSLAENWVLKYATLGFPIIRGSLLMNEVTPIPWRWLLAKCTSV